MRDARLGQRDEVGIAVHEADVRVVGDDLHDVAAQQRAGAARAVAPVQHGAAREVPAAADERQPVAELARLAFPQLDERVGAGDPALVVGVQQHRAVEARCPVGHPGVVVRVRDGDRGQPATALDLVGRLVVEVRHAVPHHEALAGRDEQRALADREPRLGADAGQLGVLAQLVAMGLRELVEGGPALAVLGDVLALVVADRAPRRRCVRVGELGGAGGADVTGHGRPSLPNQLAARQAMPTRITTAATARLRRLALAEHAGAQQRDDDDRRLAARGHDGHGRERERDEHEDVGQRAERADGEDRAAVVGQGGAQPLAVAQRRHGEDERARDLRAPVVGDRRLREVLDRVRVPERVGRDRRAR